MINLLPTPVSIDMLATLPPLPPWVWQPYVAPGQLTLFTSRWKIGKTTLLSLMLKRLEHGGTFAGAIINPGSAIVLSEETTAVWAERHRRIGFGPNVQWHCRPFQGRPSDQLWCELIASFESIRPSVVVIDPISLFLPGNIENNPCEIQNALDPLRRLAETGVAVLLVHHPKKGRENSPRGTGALTSLVDITMTMETVSDSPDDRRRRLRVNSRLAPPSTRTIELSEDGRDYHLVSAALEPGSFELAWPILKAVLDDADFRQTRLEILQNWPQDFDRPAPSTLWKWLGEAVRRRMVRRRGTGRPRDPYRYALPNFVPFLCDIPDLPDLPGQPKRSKTDLEKELARVERKSAKAAIEEEKLGIDLPVGDVP